MQAANTASASVALYVNIIATVANAMTPSTTTVTKPCVNALRTGVSEPNREVMSPSCRFSNHSSGRRST